MNCISLHGLGAIMGRVKTQLVKRATLELFEKFGDKFKGNFDENKKIVEGLAEINSKKLRNIVAGYATRLVKNKHTSD